MGRYDPEPEDVEDAPTTRLVVRMSENARNFLQANASRLRCVSTHAERDASGVSYSVCTRSERGGGEEDEWILWIHAVEFGLDRETHLGGRLHAEALRMQREVAEAAYVFLRSERETPVPSRS